MRYALLLTLFVLGCEGGPSGPVPRVAMSPTIGSRFIYDYEQDIEPVKIEDVDTTYRFTVEARIADAGLVFGGMDNITTIEWYDDDGRPMNYLRYHLQIFTDGDVYFNQPMVNNRWLHLPFGARRSFDWDTVEGLPGEQYRETRLQVRYLGDETLKVGKKSLQCRIVDYWYDIREGEPYTNDIGRKSEYVKLWFSPELGFFVRKEMELTDFSLRKPKWKFKTTEMLREYHLN